MVEVMANDRFRAYIKQTVRRFTVVVTAVAIIVGYLYLLNYFGEIFGAGQGWDNPLLWFVCALSALIVVCIVCWVLAKTTRWIASRVMNR